MDDPIANLRVALICFSDDYPDAARAIVDCIEALRARVEGMKEPKRETCPRCDNGDVCITHARVPEPGRHSEAAMCDHDGVLADKCETCGGKGVYDPGPPIRHLCGDCRGTGKRAPAGEAGEERVVTEGEATGCVPCYTCKGFKLPGAPCAFCLGARRERDSLRDALSTSRALADELRKALAEARAEVVPWRKRALDSEGYRADTSRMLGAWIEARRNDKHARKAYDFLATRSNHLHDYMYEIAKAIADGYANLDRANLAQAERDAARRELAEAEGYVRDVHALVARGDHGVKMNAACAISAIIDIREAIAEEQKRAEAAEAARDDWREKALRAANAGEELEERAEAAEAQLAEAMAVLADNNESCLKREDVAKGLAYCVRTILERWQGASDEAEKAEARARAAEWVVEAARAFDVDRAAWTAATHSVLRLREKLAAYDATSPDATK